MTRRLQDHEIPHAINQGIHDLGLGEARGDQLVDTHEGLGGIGAADVFNQIIHTFYIGQAQ